MGIWSSAIAQCPSGLSPRWQARLGTRTWAAKFDQQVQLLDEHTGEPLRRRRYRLVGELGAFGGYTDSNGMTERIVGDHPSTMKVEIFGEGA